MSPFPCTCPKCSSENVRFDYKYDTISNGSRQMLLCRDCGVSFSETKNTFLQNIRTPISVIWKVLKSRTEGTSLNATCSRTNPKTCLSTLSYLVKHVPIEVFLSLPRCLNQAFLRTDKADQPCLKQWLRACACFFFEASWLSF